NHPEVFQELAEEVKVGQKYLKVVRKTNSEVMIVPDLRMWNYFAMKPEPLEKGRVLPRSSSIHYMENFCTYVPESVKRIGASSDSYTMEDLARRRHEYKMYVFPCAGVLTAAERRQIRALAEAGATCVFTGPAGLIDPDGEASYENMSSFLGMKIRSAGIGAQDFYAVASSHPALAGISAGTRLGDGRWFDRTMPSQFHRFAVAEPAADTTILGRYSNGSAAAAMRPVGKGRFVFAGSAMTLPKIYRNLAKLSGVHVYLDTNDMTYADQNYLVLHTFGEGVKQIFLPKKARRIVEVFSGEVVGRDTASFSVKVPGKTTKVYYFGDTQID
ncbi:MAG: hypothetical protein PHS41_12900, partial [Victivallaceae bacterium]|nr:hypothetical protein [Victivallaceae bacterium]